MFAGANEFTAKAEDSPTVIADLSEEENSRLEQQQLDAILTSFNTTRADSYEYDFRTAGFYWQDGKVD